MTGLKYSRTWLIRPSRIEKRNTHLLPYGRPCGNRREETTDGVLRRTACDRGIEGIFIVVEQRAEAERRLVHGLGSPLQQDSATLERPRFLFGQDAGGVDHGLERSRFLLHDGRQLSRRACNRLQTLRDDLALDKIRTSEDGPKVASDLVHDLRGRAGRSENRVPN